VRELHDRAPNRDVLLAEWHVAKRVVRKPGVSSGAAAGKVPVEVPVEVPKSA